MVACARPRAGTRRSRQNRGQAQVGASRLGSRGRKGEEAGRRLRVAVAHVEHAPAKVNLTLAIVGRRNDGYHDIESLVAFAAVGDMLGFTPGRELALTVRGPTARAAGPLVDNLCSRVP